MSGNVIARLREACDSYPSRRSATSTNRRGDRVTALSPPGGRSAATFHDGAAHWPQPRHVRTQAIRDRVIINLLPAETRRVVAARALLLRRALMLARGCSRQDQDRQHGDGKSSHHSILLYVQSLGRLVRYFNDQTLPSVKGQDLGDAKLAHERLTCIGQTKERGCRVHLRAAPNRWPFFYTWRDGALSRRKCRERHSPGRWGRAGSV
jgi:hypothetical protein